MRAVVLDKFGGLDSLVYTELPDPFALHSHALRRNRRLSLKPSAPGSRPL
jgi:hypothetical protein